MLSCKEKRDLALTMAVKAMDAYENNGFTRNTEMTMRVYERLYDVISEEQEPKGD